MVVCLCGPLLSLCPDFPRVFPPCHLFVAFVCVDVDVGGLQRQELRDTVGDSDGDADADGEKKRKKKSSKKGKDPKRCACVRWGGLLACLLSCGTHSVLVRVRALQEAQAQVLLKEAPKEQEIAAAVAQPQPQVS